MHLNEFRRTNFLEPSGPVQARNGTALPFYLFTLTTIQLTILKIQVFSYRILR